MDKEQELENGFNAGYIIEKHNPELAKYLIEGIEQLKDSYADGFIAGSKESIKERELVKSREATKSKGLAKFRDAVKRNKPRSPINRDKNKEKGLDKDR